MGEMADMALEDTQTMEFLRDDFASGNMDILDAYDHGFVDEMGTEQESTLTTSFWLWLKAKMS